MIPVVLTVGPADTADPDGIAEAQTAAGAGALDLDGVLTTDGVATLDVARRVLWTSSGDDTGITAQITGTNADSNPIRETLAGTNASTVATVQDFLTVTEVYVSDATDGDVEVGTNGVASSPWKLTNSQHQASTQISWGCVVSGTVNYSIAYTYDNPNNNQNQMGGAAGNYPALVTTYGDIPGLSGATTTADGAIDNPIAAWRVVLNSGTGSVTVASIEGGMIQGG